MNAHDDASERYRRVQGPSPTFGKASPGFADKAQFSEVGLMIVSPSRW